MVSLAAASGQASAQTVTPTWSYTGSLNTPRYDFTATLLANGKVLVAGGISSNQQDLNSAELYDPATGTWTITGSLNVPRASHRAILLQNGKVLVVEGADSSSLAINSAELYDPATGAWSYTGSLNSNRPVYSATLLQNGKVLVTMNGTAELYDPATGAWSVTGGLNTERVGYTATLLQNGKVLVAGGQIDDDAFDYPTEFVYATELYDPTTGTWSVSGSLKTAHEDHTATLLPNGDVLVAGAYTSGFYGQKSAELYRPATAAWSISSDLNAPRFAHTATLLPNGRVLIAGGTFVDADHYQVFLNSADVYDPATGNWNPTANLNGSRSSHTATLLQNGKVLVVGGSDRYDGSLLGSAELYDSGASSFANPIDDPQFFVRQHYLDFLSREPDTDGLNFWTNQIASCGGDPQCIEIKRINVSAAYFLSIEFQQTGYLVYRFYKAAYGNAAGAPVPLRLDEFLPDTREIGQGVVVNQSGWEQVLESNKQAFATEFVQRARFVSAYPTSMSAEQFVDALFANAGVSPSATDRAAAVNEFSFHATTADVAARARALRRVAENSTLQQQGFSRAFVLMQYFGYLRRNPNDAPDGNFAGYDFWLNKLNQFNGDFVQAEMVKAFLSSIEYRRRFGQ
jgi:phage baseplate assembly protein gpV